MSSINFELPSWPDIVDDDELYQQIVIWIFCVLFILVLPLIIIYYFYGLNKLRFLMGLRKRHFKLLRFMFIVILMDLIIIEPIRLLFGTYLSNPSDIIYWIYFILSTCSSQIFIYTLLLKIWLLFFDIKWIKICCIDDNQWRYHIYNPSKLISSSSSSQQQQSNGVHSNIIPQTPPSTLNNNSMSNNSRKNGKINRDRDRTNLKDIDERKNIDNEYEDHEQHPNILKANSNLNVNKQPVMSWFVKYRQSAGNIQYIYKYFIIITIISIILSILSKCLFDDGLGTAIINIIVLIPILIMYGLWFNIPSFDDIFSLRKEVKYLLTFGAICVILSVVINIVLFVMEDADDFEYQVELQLVEIFIYHILVFGIFMFLIWYPIKSMVIIYNNRININQQEIQNGSLAADNNRTSTSIDDNKSSNSNTSSCCCISQTFINRIALYDAKVIGVNHRMSAKQSMNLQTVASSSHNPHNSNQNQLEIGIAGTQIAMTEIDHNNIHETPSFAGHASSNKTKKLKTSNGDTTNNYAFNDIENVDDDDDDDTDNGLENHDMIIDGNDDDDDELDDFNYDDGPVEEIVEEDDETTPSPHNPNNAGNTSKTVTIDIGEATNINKVVTGTSDSNNTPRPDAIIPIKPGKKTTINVIEKVNEQQILIQQGILKSKLFSNNEGITLFLSHCALEFSIENMLALIELCQFQNYCNKQERYIEQQIELRKKTAKERTRKKKQSIQKMKKHKNEELKHKKLQLMNRDSYKSRDNRHHQNGHHHHHQHHHQHHNDRNSRPQFRNNLSGNRRNHRKRTASQKRRRERIKQSNMDSDIMDDDDLILHEIASKPPIDIVVSNTLQYMENGVGDNYGFGDYNHYSSSSDRGDNGDDNKEEKKSNDDEYYEEDGNAGDDEDEEYENNIYNRMYGSMDYGFGFGVGYLLDCDKLDLPQSTIINRPFLNSKNKRIQQLELIIIDLCDKYILSKSEFQLNLPLYITNDIEHKIASMKETHQLRKEKQLNRQRMQQEREEMLRQQNGGNRNENESDSSDSDGPGPRLQLTNTESNASNWYPEHHENTLPVFFDDVIEQIVKLMNDSFYRLKFTPKYKEFVNNL